MSPGKTVHYWSPPPAPALWSTELLQHCCCLEIVFSCNKMLIKNNFTIKSLELINSIHNHQNTKSQIQLINVFGQKSWKSVWSHWKCWRGVQRHDECHHTSFSGQWRRWSQWWWCSWSRTWCVTQNIEILLSHRVVTWNGSFINFMSIVYNTLHSELVHFIILCEAPLLIMF